jgi:hypothetical protein
LRRPDEHLLTPDLSGDYVSWMADERLGFRVIADEEPKLHMRLDWVLP